MQALLDRLCISRINGYPSTISEVNESKTLLPKVRTHYLNLEKKLLKDCKDDDLFEKLIKNYDR